MIQILNSTTALREPAAAGFRTPRLEDVPVGVAVRVTDVGGDDAVAIRLLEMGLTPGVTVSLRGRALFGDPLELELRGYRLSIRRAEARRVTIESA
jgi:ferrous iron transport protein A